MIICPKCTKENQDHYKFCLGCGAELPRDASPKKFAPRANTPPHGVPSAPAVSMPPAGADIVDEGTSQGQGPGEDTPPVVCPQCSHPNPSTNKFCASCGFKLGKAASVPAPAAAAAAPVAAASNGLAPSGPPPDGSGISGGSADLATGSPTPVSGGVSLTALRADGTEAGSFHMPATPLTIGRDSGSVFAGDSYLSPRHATFTPQGRTVVVRDESSLNGIYRKIQRDEPNELQFNDIFRIGQEILRLEALVATGKNSEGVERLGSPARGYVARIALLIGRDTTGNAYPIPESGLHLGRERGDVLFPEDGYVSGLHCRIAHTNGKFHLTDLGSSNGSFVRLMKDTAISNGETLLMGQQLFRIQINP